METLVRATNAISESASNFSFPSSAIPVSARTSTFHVPLDQRAPAPGWLWPLFMGVCIATFLIPPRYRLLRIGLGGAAVFSILVYTPNYDMGDVLGNFATGVFMPGFTIKWINFAIMQESETKCWRVPEELDDASVMNKSLACKTPRTDGSWWEKFRWATSLWATDRGIGWNWKVKNIEEGKPPGYSRVKFVLEMVHEFLFSSLVIDVIICVLGKSPFGDPSPSKWPSIFDMDVLPRTAIVWHVGIGAVHGVSLGYFFLAAITVALGVCRPEQWPRLFGHWIDEGWSVRQMWGVYWHQHLRLSIKAPVDYLVKALKIPKGTMLSGYSQIWLGFATSAVLHHGGAYMLHRDARWMYQMWMYQAAAITLEDFVIWLGKRAGIKESAYTKMLGRIWLFLWLSSPFAGVTASNLFLAAGSAANDPHPIHSVLSYFQYAESCDNFYQVIADRWAVFFILAEPLNLLAARRGLDLFKALPGLVLAAALVWANAVGNMQLDVTVKAAGLTLAWAAWFRW